MKKLISFLTAVTLLTAYTRDDRPIPMEIFSDSVMECSCIGISLLEVLAHNGVIKPSEEVNTDIASIKQASRNTSGNMTLSDDSLFSDYAGKVNFIKAYSVNIDVDDEPKDFPNFRYISSDRWIDIEFLDETIAGKDAYNATTIHMVAKRFSGGLSM